MIFKISTDIIQNNLLRKNILDWSNRDLLLYFANRYKDSTGHSFNIPKQAWQGLMSRIKGFKIKMKLNNEEYKYFIDKVFDKFFIQDKYVPTFGAIVSEKVYYITNKLVKNSSCSNLEFEKLRNQLYSSELFKKLL